MFLIYYEIGFALALLLSVIYVFMWNNRYDINITAIFLLVPISNFGYMLLEMSETTGEALLSMKVIYFAAIYLPYFLFLSILNICDIKINRMLRGGLFVINSLLYLSVLTIGHSSIFYKSVRVVVAAGRLRLMRDYGFMHTVVYAMIIIYFLASLFSVIYSYYMKMQVSNRMLMLFFIPEVICVVGYFGNFIIDRTFEIIPYAYIVAQIIYLIIINRLIMYNVSEMVIESMVQTGDTGFISVDFKKRYLGSNKTAREIIPALYDLKIDQNIDEVEEVKQSVSHWIRHFEEDVTLKRNLYKIHDKEDPDNTKAYLVNINYLYEGKKKIGYQVFLDDDTQNQKYIALMNRYNNELEDEVEEKTRHITEMHDNLIMGLATMVESRDNSTGGHIKRTSMCVKFLVEEIQKVGEINLSNEFCKCLIKAAPMHDIGKIAVDDAILRFKGRYDKEQYKKMQVHAAEGARIIHEILLETDDELFKVIAENVAHYHHERMDGSGYPMGLKGEEIPIEARIMAIADVYDALVSKRVYKDSMSFEEADRIILSGMGTQFDKALERYYIAARPNLEDYYMFLEQ